MPNVVYLDRSERIEVSHSLNPADWKMLESLIEVRSELRRQSIEIWI
jgi:hypothetical protein